jgi:hypothetical protein
MAGIYSRLRLRRPDLSFYLKTDHESSLQLNAIYNKVANPAEPWPEASQTVNEWRFVTTVPSPAGDFEPLQFAYLDYPGGVLTNPRATQDENIKQLIERLRSANALLVLLDGQALLSLLRDERPGQRYMQFDLISSLEIAQQSRCPVHFAITKWDLLQEQYTLSDVRLRLMEDENFANLIQAKSQDMPGSIRLIPVSAVGFGFAQLQPSGEMKKVGTGPRPWQVEYPLAAVLPDFFHFAFEELKAKQSDLDEMKQTQLIQRWLDPSSKSKVKAILRGALQKTMPVLQQELRQRSPALGGLLALDSGWTIDSVLDFADRLVANRAARAATTRQEELLRTRERVASDQAALDLLERQCEQLISDFEIANPESVLAGGLEQFVPDVDWAASLRSAPAPPSGS